MTTRGKLLPVLGLLAACAVAAGTIWRTYNRELPPDRLTLYGNVDVREQPHDETEIFAEELEEARTASSERRPGIDGFGFIVSFKGVMLEGLEVVFIVVTFGLGAAHRGLPNAMLIASLGAVAAAAAVIVAGFIMYRPLAMVPENTMKYAVGLMLSSFGVFWVVEGMGYFGPLGESLAWPGDIWALVGIFFAWLVVSRITVLALRPLAVDSAPMAMSGVETGP